MWPGMLRVLGVPGLATLPRGFLHRPREMPCRAVLPDCDNPESRAAHSSMRPIMNPRLIFVPEFLNPTSIARLRADLAPAPEQDEAPAVVLVGSRIDVFCRGLAIPSESPEAVVDAALDDYEACLLAIRGGAPAIALVGGVALGGGVGLAAACDIVLATPDARFGLPEVVSGLVPGMVLPVLSERMTPQRARRMALVGAACDVFEASDLGLIDELVEPDSALDATDRWLRWLSRGPSQARRAIKSHYVESLGGPPSGDSATEARLSIAPRLERGKAVTRERLIQPATREALRNLSETEASTPPPPPDAAPTSDPSP